VAVATSVRGGPSTPAAKNQKRADVIQLRQRESDVGGLVNGDSDVTNRRSLCLRVDIDRSRDVTIDLSFCDTHRAKTANTIVH